MSELRLFDPNVETGSEPAPTPGVQPGATMHQNNRTHDNRTQDEPRPPQPFDVEVVRSTRRRRTISAQLHGNVLRISIPNWMSKKEELASVENMVKKFTRRLATDSIDLVARARTLASMHDLRTPAVIEWNDSLKAVWGLCTPSTKHIRLSTRLVGLPLWVLDYVIVHELAHLHVSGHGQDFWELARRYPKAERAIGYLIAKSGDETGVHNESGSGDCDLGDSC